MSGCFDYLWLSLIGWEEHVLASTVMENENIRFIGSD